MTATVLSGFWFARFFGQNESYGALAGAATAVCGASATLATSTVVPNYYGKEADIAFVVVAVNALSTAAMVIYPIVCVALGFDERLTGVMLGATIHDVAQVVGAGYAVSERAGNTAVIVKLFRVFLLLPGRARRRLVVHPQRRGAWRREGAGARLRARLPGAVHPEQPGRPAAGGRRPCTRP